MSYEICVSRFHGYGFGEDIYHWWLCSASYVMMMIFGI